MILTTLERQQIFNNPARVNVSSTFPLKSGVFVEDLFFFLMEEFYVMFFSTVKFSNTEDLFNYLT